MGLFNFGKKKKKEDVYIEFPFDAPLNVAVITCRHIMDDNKPVLLATHDYDDGGWQFLCGAAHTMDDAMVVSLEDVYYKDVTIAEISKMPPGYGAEREYVGAHWQVYRMEVEDIE